MSKRVLVVGAGFAGAVIARELATAGHKVLVIDSADHVAGHAHTVRDLRTQIMLHVYGPHIFNTDDLEVWRYVNCFGRFHSFTNRVKAVNRRGVFSMPLNLHTINQLTGKTYTPREAKDWLAAQQIKFPHEPANFEEKALSLVGPMLYELFFEHYTRKQWGREPRALPASVMSRLPIRFDYNDNYYSTRIQAIPVDGYTAVVAKILQMDEIEVRLEQPFEKVMLKEFHHVFYTGAIDHFFDFKYGRLSYRTLVFAREDGDGELQGNAVLNYTDDAVPWTRVSEPKYFTPWETHKRTVTFKELSRESQPGDPLFYPVRAEQDRALFSLYRKESDEMPNVIFAGRLGQYQYLDMDDVIRDALDTVRAYLKSGK